MSANFIGYQVMVSPPPPSVATPILVPRTSISSTFILRDLASFTSYTVTVATYNNDGVGPLTESVTITTPETGKVCLEKINVDLPINRNADGENI